MAALTEPPSLLSYMLGAIIMLVGVVLPLVAVNLRNRRLASAPSRAR